MTNYPIRAATCALALVTVGLSVVGVFVTVNTGIFAGIAVFLSAVVPAAVAVDQLAPTRPLSSRSFLVRTGLLLVSIYMIVHYLGMLADHLSGKLTINTVGFVFLALLLSVATFALLLSIASLVPVARSGADETSAAR